MESYVRTRFYQENASVKCIRPRRIAAGGVKQVKIGQLWMKGQPWIERNKNRKYLSVLPPLLLLLLTVFFCWLFCLRFGVFGSKIDWISQHSVIPDYFRQQFYDTGNFFPEFAANLGAGQNIYHYSYYGLYSPVILVSYLLPFVKMSDYMMAAQFVCLASSVILMYIWLQKQQFRKSICFGTAVLFLLAAPMIFHSYNQIMFVNYMPFLCMGLLSVDRYFQSEAGGRKKGGLLILSVFLMIMTSFYFSIGGMLVLGVYAVHRYLLECDRRGLRITVLDFIKEGVGFAARLIMAVMMSGVLLIPTLYALTGRGSGTNDISWKELLIPQFHIKEFCYTPYGLGLTTLAFTVLLSVLFFKKRHNKILAGSSLILLLIPMFSWMLNGGLYIRDKALIPFLPVLCYLIALYLHSMEKVRKTKMELCWYICPYILTIILIVLQREQIGANWQFLLFMADAVFMLLCFCIFCKKRNALVILTPAICFLILFGTVCHQKMDRAIDTEYYKALTDKEIGSLIKETLDGETGMYRTEQAGSSDENGANINRIWTEQQYISSMYSSGYHQGYDSFRKETFQLEQPFRNCLMQSFSYNPVFQRLMGIKYILSKKDISGYEKVGEQGDWNVYENKSVSPVIYSTDRVMTASEYEKLEFPYNQLALLYYAVANNNVAADEGKESYIGVQEEIRKDGNIQDIFDEFVSGISESSWLKKSSGRIDISAEEEKKISVSVPQEENSQGKQDDGRQNVIFIQFKVKNLHPNQDMSIQVGDVKNTLTAKCHYYYNDNTTFSFAVPLEEGQEAVEISFKKGEYQLSDMQVYQGSLPAQSGLYQSELSLDKDKTKGNVISGEITVTKAGYLVTTIPYENNFTVYVDGKKTETKEVDTAFLGCLIEEGTHSIEIVYHAPGLSAGKAMSLSGWLLFALLSGIQEWRKRREPAV